MNPPTLTPGTVFANRYVVVRPIAGGGMGAVYEVTHTLTRRRHALKVLLPQLIDNDDMRKRFIREARLGAEIASEHVVETIDAGVDDASGTPFIVMELLDGETLVERIDARGALPASEVLPLLEQVAGALDKAHAAGIIHRDLKPDNLFITTRRDGSVLAKLLDFGIAKVIDSSTVATTGILGTPLYMAPEQVHNEAPVSAQTDIFALGQLAYCALVGEAYWAPEQEREQGVVALLIAVMSGAPEPASARARQRRGVSLPAAFDDWFVRATAAEPRQRFETATAQVQALVAALQA